MAEFQEVMKHWKRMCDTSKCENCGLDKECGCDTYINNNLKQAEEIIMKWAEEHPIQTNADKFKEVFGYDIDPKVDCCRLEACDGECDKCKFDDFWNQEYKEPKGE